MKRIATILAAVIVMASMTSAAFATTRLRCPDGWNAVVAGANPRHEGVSATIEGGDTLVAWNFFESESSGNLYINGVLVGPAPVANGDTSTYTYEGSGPWVVTAADGHVSVCVKGQATTPPETTTSTTTTTVQVPSTTLAPPTSTSTTVPGGPPSSTPWPPQVTTTPPTTPPTDTPTTLVVGPPPSLEAPPPSTPTGDDSSVTEEPVLPVTGLEAWEWLLIAALLIAGGGLLIWLVRPTMDNIVTFEEDDVV